MHLWARQGGTCARPQFLSLQGKSRVCCHLDLASGKHNDDLLSVLVFILGTEKVQIYAKTLPTVTFPEKETFAVFPWEDMQPSFPSCERQPSSKKHRLLNRPRPGSGVWGQFSE